MTQTPEVHSDIVGGSTAERLLSCPGSWQATAALPRSLTSRTSEYAEEGTAMHAVMRELMIQRRAQAVAPEALLGIKFHDRALTQAHIDTMIGPALECLAEMEQAYGGNFTVVGVEQSVRFPGIPGAFGTCDLILQSPTVVLHVDWKFGAGVGVSATYRDEAGERVNAQLMFYLTGAMHTHKRLYDDNRALGVAVIQPRAEQQLTVVTVSRKEVRWFREDLERAVAIALTRNPPRHRGEHCRFAPCKSTCPLWTGPLLDLSALGVAPPKPETPSRDATDAYGAYLAYAKALVDIVSGLKAEIDAQMHTYLEAGGAVPGWRLKAKKKMRQWVDIDTVEPALFALGFKSEEIWQPELVSFGKADATAKRLGVKIPDALRVAPATNETTLAPTDDPAPVVDKALALEQFGSALTEWNARNALQQDCDAPISN